MSRGDEQNFYYARRRAPPPHAPLRGETRADVCIVGGGISGLSAALHLVERGFSVALLEAKHLGFGGSGRSGGQIHLRLCLRAGQRSRRLVGAADARRMWDIVARGHEAAARADRPAFHRLRLRGRPHDRRPEARHDDELRAEVESLHTKYDYRTLRLMGREELRSIIASDRYTSGLYDANGGHLHPYSYTLGLGAAAARAGVRIFENSWVTQLDLAQTPTADNLAHTESGHGARASPADRRRCVVRAAGAAAGPQAHVHRHLHRGHEVAGRRTRARADHQQRGRRRT